jgi:prolyl oligopeptidase
MKQLRLRRVAFCALPLALSVGSGCATTPMTGGARNAAPRYSAKQFFDTTTVFGGSFSADESRILITSDASGVFNAFAQPVTSGEPIQLTDSTTNAVMGVSYFPRDDRILYTADQGGNERNHLFVRDPDGSTTDLTPGEDLKASFVRWSGDKLSFWVLTNERDENYFDLYRYTTDGYSKQLIFTNKDGWDVSDVSKDGRWIALTKIRNNADSDVYIWDSKDPDAAPRHITPHQGDVSHSVHTFTPDSKRILYSSNERGEFEEAWSYDLATGDRRAVVAAPWDVMYVYFSENGKYRVTGVNQDARTVVTLENMETGRKVRLPDLPEGDITGIRISPSETKMAFYVNGDTSPSNLFMLDLESNAYERLTDTLNPAMDRDDLVAGEVVRYKSFDGLQIPAVLYRPHSASSGNEVPALVWVHGGPGGQSRHGYRAEIQHLVNHGYAILAVNNRGSSGYGKTFFHLDDRKHGDVDLEDCVHGRKYLESLPWVDGDRIGIIGGSYGGYMVAAALTFEPEAFDVGIDIFGVTNWLRTLESIPAWWSAFREALYAEMGDPETDRERLHRISPLFHASNIKRPLLVVQGANDPRVLQVESDEIVEAARANGVPVEYIVFPDEGHGFRRKENRIRASDAFVDFLDKHLKGT